MVCCVGGPNSLASLRGLHRSQPYSFFPLLFEGRDVGEEKRGATGHTMKSSSIDRTVEQKDKEAKFAETVYESEDKFLGGSNGCASQSNYTTSSHGFGLLYSPLEPIHVSRASRHGIVYVPVCLRSPTIASLACLSRAKPWLLT